MRGTQRRLSGRCARLVGNAAGGVSAVASILALRVHASGHTVLADSSRYEWPLCRAFSARGAHPGCGLAVLQEYGPSCCPACSVLASFFAMLHVAGVRLSPPHTRPCSHPSGVASILYIAIHSRWHIPTVFARGLSVLLEQGTGGLL